MEKTFNQSYDIVYKKCKETLKALGIGIDKSDLTNGLILASTSGSIFSWGEEIQIQIKKLGSAKTKVIVESNASAQLFSWGKNTSNENSVIETLAKKLSP